MAGNIKGITVEIGGDTTQLQQALKKVEQDGKHLKSQLSDINKLLRLDPSNTVLLAQKQRVLAEVIENTKQKLETLKTAQEEAARQLANEEIGQEQYEALERQVIETEQSLNRLEGQAGEVDEALRQAGEAAQGGADDMKQMGDASREAGDQTRNMSENSAVSFAAMTASISAIIQKVIELCEKFKEAALSAAVWADDMNTLSAQTHVSTETLQKFAYAADIIDVSIDTFAGAMGKLTKNMDKAAGGTKAQQEAFDRLGVSVTDSNGSLRNAEDVFYDVIDALGRMENETEADATANAIFGRSFQDLNPLVSAGTDTLKELGDEAMRTGYVMSQDALDGTNSLQDSLDRLKNMTDMSKRSFSEGLAPALDEVVQKMNEGLANPEVQEKLKQLGEAIGEIVKAFAEFVGFLVENSDVVLAVIAGIAAGFAAWKITTIIQSVITFVQKFATKFAEAGKNVITMIKKMNSATMATLIGAIAAVVIAAGQLIDKFNGASEEARKFKDDCKNLNETAQGLAGEFAKTSETLNINADNARRLAGEIKALDDNIKSGTLSDQEAAEAKAELKAKTVEYNAAVGEEALKIDEATGALLGDTDALTANTEALIENARAAAEIKALEEAYQAQADAQAQIAAGLAEIKSHYDELSPSQQALIDQMEQEGVTLENLSELRWASWTWFSKTDNEIRTYVEALMEAVPAEEAFGAQAEILSSQMKETAKAAQEQAEETERQKTAVESLTEAEALRLLRMQESGEQLSELQRQQLEAYKANNEEQYAAMEELVQKEAQFAAARLAVIQNSNEQIKLSMDVSLQDRIENQRHNIELWSNYENNIARLRLESANIQNADQRAAMQAYVATLEDGSVESMSIVQQMVDAIADTSGEGGREMVLELAEMYYSTLDSERPGMLASANETGDSITSETGKGVANNQELDAASRKQINDSVQTMTDMVVGGTRFSNVGNQMIRQIITGLQNAKDSLLSYVQSIVDQVNARLKFNASVNVGASGGSGGKVGHKATGGVVYNRQITEVAEIEPEAIIPLSRMGDVVEGVLSRARGSGGAAAGSGAVYVQPQITINVQRLTEAEMTRCADYTSRVFARALGGRMR